jgi:hypothetical protein
MSAMAPVLVNSTKAATALQSPYIARAGYG